MWWTLTYTFLGGLGLFFFGMKTLSEALQAIAGDLIQKIIHFLTSNRLSAVGVGALITMIVQSSSVTTVMVVGLVNANLMQLTQAIGVIMGANIGTTITGWIIAIKIGKYGLLLVGLGAFPYIFSKNNTFRSIGRLLIALGFIFMGLEFMGTAFKPLRTHPGFMELLVYFSADNLLSLLACVAMGTILTCLIQSSSAMLGITIALATTNTITFQTAAALVMGENIGTTITALLASVGTNSHAKRAARAHALFNLGGVLWLAPIFWLYISGVDSLVAGAADFVAEDGTKPFIAAHIAASHSIFNIVNTIVFLPFIGWLAKAVTWLVPAPKGKERPKFQYLPNVIGASPNLAIASAQKELIHLADIVSRTLSLASQYVLSTKLSRSIANKVSHYESITDTIQGEITLFLCRAQEARMTQEENSQVYGLIRSADELESIADYCEAMVRYRKRLDEGGRVFTEDAHKELEGYAKKVSEMFDEMYQCLKGEKQWDVDEVRAKNLSLYQKEERIMLAHQKRLEAGVCQPTIGMVFSDLLYAVGKMRRHVVNISEALSGRKLANK